MSERASFSEATPAVSVSRRSVAIVAATLAITFLTPPLFAEAPVTAPISDAEVFGTTRDAFGIDRGEAERIFASSEAAIYFPALGRARWFDVAGGNARFDDGIAESLQGFRDRLDHDFPGLRANAFGPWLMKSPAIARSVSVATSSASITPSAAAFSDSFESGLVNWDTSNNTLDLYDWGTTTCEARSGSRSADALRGGVNSLSCADSYASNVETTMIHNACEAITAADEAWLDLYVHVATESGYDTLGLFYAGSDQRYGYTFSGTWSAWFHVVFNLKQWYRVGDVTASTCPNLMIQFESDSDTEPGIGARIDDLTISTSAPSFLACAITASPASGAAPLTVSFTPAVNGASGSTVYLWSFGDAAGTTAATSASSFTYTEPGDYQVRLRVENQGIRAYAHKTIHVTSGSACSLSCTALVPASASAGSPAAFQSTATATGCSESPTFSWNFGDGQTSSQQNPSHTYPSSGTYSWTLTTRASGQSCTRSGSITVSSSGTKPRSRPVRRSDDTIASATIGTSGGTLVGGGFKLTVPAGAFSANASLTLSRVATPQLDRGEVSDKFRLSGTPEAIAKDLTLEIELPSSTPPLTSGQRYYVSVDAPAYVEHSVAKAPFRLLATVNSRKLGVTIPKSWTALSKVTAAGLQTAPEFDDDDHPDLDLQAIISTTFETTHFTASVLPYAASNTPAILNLLEAHFKRLEDSGFSFACRVDGQTFRKIEVVPWFLGTAKDDPLGEHVSRSSPCGSGWIFNDYLVVTLSYPATDKSVDYAAGHELFHLLQDIYSPGGATANLWLKEASSIWYELIVGNPCPTVQSANTFFPWNGLFNSKKSAVEPGTKPTDLEAHHGYGASYLLFRRTKSLSDPAQHLEFHQGREQRVRRGRKGVWRMVEPQIGMVQIRERLFRREDEHGRLSRYIPRRGRRFSEGGARKRGLSSEGLHDRCLSAIGEIVGGRSQDVHCEHRATSHVDRHRAHRESKCVRLRHEGSGRSRRVDSAESQLRHRGSQRNERRRACDGHRRHELAVAA